MIFARIGAALYVLWGLVHLKAAYDQFVVGAALEPGLVQGKINQGAWDLVFFASFSIVVAVLYNWKNDRRGYWLNLVVVSAADLGFIIFVLIPGYVALNPGIVGPSLWIAAVIFTTIGIRTKAGNEVTTVPVKT